jgi:hypothetical protein
MSGLSQGALIGRYTLDGQSDLVQLVDPGNGVMLAINNQGKFTNYAGLPLVNSGVPTQIASFDAASQGAAITSQFLYTTSQSDTGQVGDFYNAFYSAKLVQAASSSSLLGGSGGITFNYVSGDDGVSLSTIPGVLNGNVGHNDLTSTVGAGVFTFYAKALTTIQFNFGYVSSGATPMLYNLHVRLFRV